MQEERARILRLLEEGKITADQAARLIQALGAGRTESEEFSSGFGHRRWGRAIVGELDRIPDIVAQAVSSALSSGFGAGEKSQVEFLDKKNLFLKSVSGNVQLLGWDQKRIILEGSGTPMWVREKGDQLMVRSISGDVTGNVPAETRLEVASVSGDITVSGVRGKFGLKSVSGNVELADFHGEVEISSVSGDVSLLRVSGRMKIETHSGDIEILPVGEFEGEVVTKSGDIELRLEVGADVLLEAECEEAGEVHLEEGFAAEVLEQTGRLVRLKFGAGSRIMKLRTHCADIKVRRAEKA